MSFLFTNLFWDAEDFWISSQMKLSVWIKIFLFERMPLKHETHCHLVEILLKSVWYALVPMLAMTLVDIFSIFIIYDWFSNEIFVMICCVF